MNENSCDLAPKYIQCLLKCCSQIDHNRVSRKFQGKTLEKNENRSTVQNFLFFAKPPLGFQNKIFRPKMWVRAKTAKLPITLENTNNEQI